MNNSRVVTAHLPTELAAKLDDIALEQKRHRMTLEALVDVDAGRTMDHAEIERWARRIERSRKARGR